MTGPKLNEAPVIRRRPESRAQAVATTSSARAVARHVRVSPYKIREVLDLIRGHEVQRAQDLLRLCERDAALVVGKLLASAMANAEHNHALVTDELFVSACFADEGPTLKRWRPRARGRATRIRKRTAHVTVIVSRLPESELRQRRAQRAQAATGRRGGPRRSPAPGGAGRPDRAGGGRGRRRGDQLPVAGGRPPGVGTPPVAPAEPDAQAPAPEAPPEMAENDDTAPGAEPVTDAPEVRTEGPAAGGTGATDAPTGGGEEDKE